MKLLIVGQDARSRSLSDFLQRGRHAVTYCADARSAYEELRRDHAEYGWIFLQADDESVRMAGALSSMGVEAPVTLLVHCADGTAPSEPLVCAVECTPTGLQTLRCALQRIQRQPRVNPTLYEAMKEKSLVFEYHKPCKTES